MINHHSEDCIFVLSKDALEIRLYLHDRGGLVQFADNLESSEKCLPELLSLSTMDLSSQSGAERLVKTRTPPMKASELWCEKPAILLCIRRPGAEANQLYSKKPVFDALRVQIFVVLHEHMKSEVYFSTHMIMRCNWLMNAQSYHLMVSVKDSWPKYWGDIVLFDKGMEFFKALGGGKLLKDKFVSGFLFNPKAIANYKRAKAMGIDQHFKGEGEVKGGLLIIGKGKSGIAYQFIERNFGDWAPLAEAVKFCTRFQVVF
ncbi:unnamed protein product [Fraxinus pennsylvanica]|uniref:Peroxiredoxin-like 2A n=1 Tax=Fraxinus pennsylvanica TaxID=56036 RepID=A0AAD2E2V5_9LAMI|nr:unnamed protein product [Fraxinus pennsylvanica]